MTDPIGWPWDRRVARTGGQDADGVATPEGGAARGSSPSGDEIPAQAPGDAAPPRRARRTRRASVLEPTFDPAVARDGAVPARPTELRLARLHLRMGQLLLARAKLEALAGRGMLDEAALLDLAEARWRTGDLAGAGEAAGALLARGVEEPLALLIAAESVAGQGRPGEARRLAGRALAVALGPLAAIFAGMPRSQIWPEDPAPDTLAAPNDGTVGAHGEHPGHAGRPRHPVLVVDPEAPASTAAAEAFAGGRAALAGGEPGLAALRLAVALRLDPGFADGVLDAIGDWERDPGLALVAGDALRLLGREAEALAAFDRARGRS